MSRRGKIQAISLGVVACALAAAFSYRPSHVRPGPPPAAKVAKAVEKVPHKYGRLKPSSTPHPSLRFSVRHAVSSSNPPAGDLRPIDVPTVNQEQLGSCTANAWGNAARFHGKNAPPPPLTFWQRVLRIASLGFWRPSAPADTSVEPSRLAIYYDERARHGWQDEDSGAEVSDGAAVVSQIGVAPETVWPYLTADYRTKPPDEYYTLAAAQKLPVPASVDTTSIDELRTAITHGHPVVFGFDVYASFEQLGPDAIYTPSGQAVGGHCVYAVGYDDAKQLVTVHNSWGEDWGDHGYFYMPYRVYTSAQCSDGWTLADDATRAQAALLPAARMPPTSSPVFPTASPQSPALSRVVGYDEAKQVFHVEVPFSALLDGGPAWPVIQSPSPAVLPTQPPAKAPAAAPTKKAA